MYWHWAVGVREAKTFVLQQTKGGFFTVATCLHHDNAGGCRHWKVQIFPEAEVHILFVVVCPNEISVNKYLRTFNFFYYLIAAK